jgi:hypothetical protein
MYNYDRIFGMSQSEKTISPIHYISYALLFFLIAFSNIYFGGVTPFGLWGSGFLIFLYACVASFSVWKNKALHIPRSVAFIFYFLFLFHAALGCMGSLDTYSSLTHLTALLFFLILTLSIVNTFTAEGIESFIRVLSYLVAGLALFGLYAYYSKNYDLLIINRLLYRDRLTSTFINPNHFGALLNLALPLLYYSVLTVKGFLRFIFTVLFLVCICALICTFSYSSLIASLLGFCFLLLLVSSRARIVPLAVSLLFLVSGLGYFTFFKFLNIVDKSYSFYEHWTLLKGCAQYLWEKLFQDPVTFLQGSGLGTFELIAQKAIALFGFRTIDFAHNEYVQVCIEVGFIGFLFFALYFISILFIRKGTESKYALLAHCLKAALFSFMVHMTFDFSFHIPGLMIVTATIISFIYILYGRTISLNRTFVFPFISLAFIGTLVCTFVFMGEFYLKKASDLSRKDETQFMKAANKATFFASQNADIYSEVAELWLFRAQFIDDNAYLLSRSRQLFNQAITYNPHRAKYYARRGDVNVLLGDVNAAEIDYSEAVKRAPYFALPYIKRITFYFQASELYYAKALHDLRVLLGLANSHMFQNLSEKREFFKLIFELIPETASDPELTGIRDYLLQMASA